MTETSKQVGEARDRWPWVERAVWTERMLAALEVGLEGGKWFSLMDKVYAPRNLTAAWERVRSLKGAAGVDGMTVDAFEALKEEALARLSERLRSGTYRPRPVRRVYIPKPGSQEKRPIGIPTVEDRIAQTALRNVLTPIFEKKFAEHSYGFRPGRRCRHALRRVQELLDRGNTWVVDADIQSYFDTIPHNRLMKEVEAEVSDGRVLELVRLYLGQGVLEGLESWTPEEGTPQGAVISPLLANIYLHPADVEMSISGYEMVRYADDLVVLCRTGAEAQAALKRLREWMEGRGLTLHPTKTRIVDATQGGGFGCLGYHFEHGRKTPRKKSLDRMKDTIRAKTKRNNGHALSVIITDVNLTLRGWFEYFKHSHKWTFENIDAWARMRLRSILRRHQHKRGRGRGSDHQRWKNAFFKQEGLFTLTEAHAKAVALAHALPVPARGC